MSKQKSDMLFWGELVPNTLTGVSIASTSILKILAEKNYTIVRVEEKLWNKGKAGKLFSYLGDCYRLIITSVKFRFRYFYFMLPASKLSLCKSFFLLPVLKLIQPSMIFTAHVHRGDIKDFYNQSSFNKFLLNIILKFTDKIIALSPAFEEQVQEIGFNKRTEVLRNTCFFEEFKFAAKGQYIQNFICLTNYIRTKGLIELATCFSGKEMLDMKLDIYGSRFEQNTFNEISKIISSNTHTHEALSREKLPETLVKYDALILASWNEGQPTVIIEAMALGIPVIVSDVGDVRNMVGEDYPFIFPAKNMEQMKMKITEFHNYADKAGISNLLKERYYRFFSNEIYKKEIARIFQ